MACVGVDVNRNFDVGFGEIGTVSSFVDWMASNNTCDEMYHGSNSFSSSEAKGIQSAVTPYSEKSRVSSLSNCSYIWAGNHYRSFLSM